MIDRAAVGGMVRGEKIELISTDPTPATSRRSQPPLVNFNFPRKVVLFTPVKPAEYIRRIAGIVLKYDREQGEKILHREMIVVTQNLTATGADPVVINREVRKLEASIRAQMWHLVMNNEVSK